MELSSNCDGMNVVWLERICLLTAKSHAILAKSSKTKSCLRISGDEIFVNVLLISLVSDESGNSPQIKLVMMTSQQSAGQTDI